MDSGACSSGTHRQRGRPFFVCCASFAGYVSQDVAYRRVDSELLYFLLSFRYIARSAGLRRDGSGSSLWHGHVWLHIQPCADSAAIPQNSPAFKFQCWCLNTFHSDSSGANARRLHSLRGSVDTPIACIPVKLRVLVRHWRISASHRRLGSVMKLQRNSFHHQQRGLPCRAVSRTMQAVIMDENR